MRLSDEDFMRQALSLATKGRKWASPNPMVGAVIVREGKVVGKGYHRGYGGPHAEVEALSRVQGPLEGATLYVNLEPCCHYGKTPPCTQAILEAGIREVVVGTLDPNPLVKGKGVEELRRAGVSVRVGVLEKECREVNRVFFHWMENKRPWVTIKWAQSVDGCVATAQGDSKWISSEASRRLAHELRAEHDAILVGAGTVRRDDPELTVRYVKGRDPLRVILTMSLDLPLNAKALRGPTGKCLVACVYPPNSRKARLLEDAGARVVACPTGPKGGVDLGWLLENLARMQVSSILVEGGPQVVASFFEAGIFERIVCFVAPVIIGSGIHAVGDLGIQKVKEAIKLGPPKTRRIGPDVVLDFDSRHSQPPERGSYG